MIVAFALSLPLAAGFTLSTLDPPTSLEGAGWECADVVDGKTQSFAPVAIPQSKDAANCTAPVVELHTSIAIPEAMRDATLGISLGQVKGAYEVKANGARVGGLGTFAPLVDALQEGAAFTLPRDAVAGGNVDVAVRVARNEAALKTSTDHRAVVDGPVFIGTMPGANDRAAAAVRDRSLVHVGAAIAFAALYLFVGLYHILVWLLRRDLVGYVWFGVFALTADAWVTMVTIGGSPSLPWTASTIAIVGNFVGSFANVAFIEFFWWFLTKKPPPRRWRVAQLILVVIAFISFIPSVGIPWSVSPPVVAYKLIVLPVAIGEIIRMARKKNRDARVLLVGMVLAVSLGPLQWWVMANAIKLDVEPGQVALAIFFLFMAIALAAQFARTLDAVDARAKELAETNASIARFVPHPFLKAIDRESVKDVKRGDAIATTMSVMFCDLRGFTSIAEKLGPRETFAFINDYLAKMEPEIIKTGGFINQYLGDGIMALFPSADAAVNAAVAMARALEAINEKRDEKLRIGIGIHTGPLMLGTIGGGDQLDSGVVGDVVNTAARLEGITKMYGATVLMSGATLTALTSAGKHAFRPLDAVRAKGKSEPLPLVEVLDADPKALREAKVASRGDLEVALASYRKGSFDDAVAKFDALAAQTPGDGAVHALAERCRAFTSSPPESWDGVLSLTTK